MDNKPVKVKVPPIKQIAISGSGNLVIPADFRNKIRYLCSQISTIEWSGVLFYDVTGDIDNVSELTCTLKDIHLMDIGNKTYTEYEVDGSIMDLYDLKPELLDMKRAHIHSHNTFSVFFSGTDTDEIVDNSANHDMYLSVIVNNAGDVCAKIAFRGKYKVVAENKYSYKNILGTIIDKIINVDTEEDVVYIAEMKLQDEPETVEQYFIDRVVTVKDSKKKKALPVKYTGYNDRLPFEDDFNGKYGYNQQHTTTKYKPYTGGMLTDPQVYSFILKVICIDETEFTYSRVDFEKKAKKCVEDKVKECVNGSLVDLYLNACDDVIEDMFSIFLGTPFDSKNKLHIDKFVDACERAEWNMQQILKEFDKDNKAFEESDLCGEIVEMFKLFAITYEMEEVKVEEIVD